MAQAQPHNDFKELLLLIKEWLTKEEQECEVFGILVIGETGSGKSTLINNLLLRPVTPAEQASSLRPNSSKFDSQTSKIEKHHVTVEGVPITLYDTPGLDDTRGGDIDESHLEQMKKILDTNSIQLVVYCFRLTETRMRGRLIHTFTEYHRIGMKWEQTVIALTFADALPVPGKEKKKKGYKLSKYFDSQVKELHSHIVKTLEETVEVMPEAVQKIKVCPTTSETDELLPNGNEWFIPLWLGVLELLSPAAMEQYLQICSSCAEGKEYSGLHLEHKEEEKMKKIIMDKLSKSSSEVRSKLADRLKSLRIGRYIKSLFSRKKK